MKNISRNRLQDYDTYTMPLKKKTTYILSAAAVIFIVGYIFYHSVALSILLCPLSFFYPGMKEKEIIKRRKNDLNLQFKDMLYSLSSSLSAGRSIETAFQSVLADLSILYGDNEASIIVEMECIINKIKLNETVESALIDFAERAHLEDIDNFVDVFQICKRTGGNIIEVLKNASNIINDKIEIKQEIDTLLAERRFEQKILNILPILMIILLSVSAGDYIAPVFNTVIGRLAMTLSVVLLLVAYLISKKIMDIRV